MRCFNPLTQIESGDSTPSTGKTVEDGVTLPLDNNNMKNIMVIEFWSYSELRSDSNTQYYTGGKTLSTLCDGTIMSLKETLNALREVYGHNTYIRSSSIFTEEEWLLKEALQYGKGYYNPLRRHCLPIVETTWSYYRGHEWEEEELSHTWHPQIGAAEKSNIWVMQLRSSDEYGPISLEMVDPNKSTYIHSECEVYMSASLEKLKRELTRFDLDYVHIQKKDMFGPAILCPVQRISSEKLVKLLDRKLTSSWR